MLGGEVVAQERRKTHHHLGKEEVVQALQEAAVESLWHLFWRDLRSLDIFCPIAMAVSSKKKATYAEPISKCEVQMID